MSGTGTSDTRRSDSPASGNPSGRPSAAALAPLFELIREPMVQVEKDLDALYRSGYKGVDELLRYIAGYRGKRMRPAIVLLTGLACGKLTPEHVKLAVVLEVLHTATLIHDDIIDEADVRRNVESVNTRFGNETAVLLGDFLFSESFRIAVELEDAQVGREVSLLCRDLCLGEMLEITLRHDLGLDEDEYLDVIEKKTAVLFEVGCGLAARLSGADETREEALREFARCMGLAFQVVDDCLDLVGAEGDMGKSLGNDVAHGMTTLPFIHFLRTASEERGQAFREAFAQPIGAERDVAIRAFLAETDSVEYAYGRAREWTARARACLETLPETPYRKALVEILEFVVSRIC